MAIFQVPFLRILRGKFRLKSNENSKSAIIQQTLTNQEEKTVAGKLDRDYWHQHFEELLKKLNLAVDLFHLEFKREIHQGTGEIMVSIINKETGEILRQVPPEKILDMVAEMLKQLGLTVDVQA